MPAIVVSKYKEADEFLRHNTLRQGLYDEGAILMKDVLVNLFGEEHQARRHLAQKLFRREYFRNYERKIFPQTIRETLAPYLRGGGGDMADFGYHVLMNLTADSSGIDRPELFALTKVRRPIRVHDLRASFVSLALANGRSEAWISDRTGHRSSTMIHRYKRQARHAEELGLGWFAPLADALMSGYTLATR